MKPIIYLAGPYSHKDSDVREHRAIQHAKTAFTLMQDGICIYSPICETVMLAQHSNCTNTGWDFWKTQDIPKLNACSEMWVLIIDGWKESVGVRAEIKFCMAHGKPVALIDEESLTVVYPTKQYLLHALNVDTEAQLND